MHGCVCIVVGTLDTYEVSGLHLLAANLMCACFTEIELVCMKFLKISGLALSIYNIHKILFCLLNHCSSYWSCCTKSLQMSLRISLEGCFFSANLVCDITSCVDCVVLEGCGIDFDPVVHVECEGAHIGCWYLSQLVYPKFC